MFHRVILDNHLVYEKKRTEERINLNSYLRKILVSKIRQSLVKKKDF